MGWIRTLFLGDIGNRLDIGDAERSIARLRENLQRAKSIDRTQDERLDALEQENYDLKLAFAALTDLLVRHNVLTQEDVESTFTFVDEASNL